MDERGCVGVGVGVGEWVGGCVLYLIFVFCWRIHWLPGDYSVWSGE